MALPGGVTTDLNNRDTAVSNLVSALNTAATHFNTIISLGASACSGAGVPASKRVGAELTDREYLMHLVLSHLANQASPAISVKYDGRFNGTAHGPVLTGTLASEATAQRTRLTQWYDSRQ